MNSHTVQQCQTYMVDQLRRKHSGNPERSFTSANNYTVLIIYIYTIKKSNKNYMQLSLARENKVSMSTEKLFGGNEVLKRETRITFQV